MSKIALLDISDAEILSGSCFAGQPVYKCYSLPTKAPNTKRIQDNIQASMAVKPGIISSDQALTLKQSLMIPSALGVFVVTVLKMLTRTRKRVTRSAILPGMTSGGTTKLIQDTTTNRPEYQSQDTKEICCIYQMVGSRLSGNEICA